MVRPGLPKSIRLTIDFTSSTSTMFHREQMRTVAGEGKNPKNHATEALKKLKIIVKEVGSAIGINNIELMKEGKHPPSKLYGSPNKKRGDSISKDKTKEGSKIQVNWDANQKRLWSSMGENRCGTIINKPN